MKCIKSIAALLFFMIVFDNVNAQELKVGDKIPPMVITQLIGNERQSVQVADLYKKGLLIIDFWATWCVPCIREIKIVDSLATKHKRLSFLSVSIDDSLKAYIFLKRHPEISTKNIIVTSDNKLLNQYFKHTSIPHNIWIDSHGIVRLISEGDAVTEKNILTYINGN